MNTKINYNSNTGGYVLAILGSVSYGLNPLFALPLYAHNYSPTEVVFYRYIMAAVIMSFIVWLKGERLIMSRRETWQAALMGIFFALSSLLLFASFVYIDAGIASTILFTYPLFVALMQWKFFGEKASAATWTALLLATIGIVLLYETDGKTLDPIGVVLVLLSSLTYAIYIVGVNRSSLKSMHTMTLTFYTLISGTILFSAVLAIEGGLSPLRVPSDYLNAAGLAIFPTILSLVMVTRSIHTIGSTPASIIGALETLTALGISLLFFDGHLNLSNWLGILLVLFAVALTVIKK